MKRYISQALMLLAMPLAAEANSFAIVIDSKTNEVVSYEDDFE